MKFNRDTKKKIMETLSFVRATINDNIDLVRKDGQKELLKDAIMKKAPHLDIKDIKVSDTQRVDTFVIHKLNGHISNLKILEKFLKEDCQW